MDNIDDLIAKKQIVMYTATINGHTRFMRRKSSIIGWLVKQLMLAIIYPRDVDDHSCFEDWDLVKKKSIEIIQTQGIEATRAYITNYLENDYCPSLGNDN